MKRSLLPVVASVLLQACAPAAQDGLPSTTEHAFPSGPPRCTIQKLIIFDETIAVAYSPGSRGLQLIRERSGITHSDACWQAVATE